ncbi:MAG: hypothetical protein KA104_03030 [Candidatus Pacebacteria bacterium]|nr:hypothetical protein [Candidatus Paceibacterota bacterium]
MLPYSFPATSKRGLPVMAFVLTSILGPAMGKLLTGSEPESPDYETHEQESGESPRPGMAEEFAEWGRN